jgi:NAD(P)-dependent dehydrogenase (short-subunit alcohol dehydrogenase family)
VALAKQGHKVYAAARRVERMEPLREWGVVPIQMDVTDEASMRQGVQALLDREGRIDVLVNNAGYGFFGAVENVPMDDARNQLEVNIFGLARLTQLVLPYMRTQHSGRIVNIASVAGHVTFYFGAWYHATKYALEAFSDALRMEVRPYGIDVVIIEPGAIQTAWGLIAADHLRDSAKGGPYEDEALKAAAGLRRMYEGKGLTDPAVISRKIARAAVCARPRTRYLTGRGAKLFVVLHALLPTRWWDRIVTFSMTHI